MTQRNQRLVDLAISDSGFVFDPRTGDVFTVNTTGRAILLMLKEGVEAAEIVEKLQDQFDIEGEDVSRDVLEFLAILRDYGLDGELEGQS